MAPWVSEDMAKEIFLQCWWEYKMVQPQGKTDLWFLTELNTLFSYDLAIRLLDISSSELRHINEFYRSFIHNCKTQKKPGVLL